MNGTWNVEGRHQLYMFYYTVIVAIHAADKETLTFPAQMRELANWCHMWNSS